MITNKKPLKELCDVSIGRTPPRAEQCWFNGGKSSDWDWVSIKDMGNINKYIGSSSETITANGQKRFNIPIVKKGTVLVSFKLTVGRLAIANRDLLTNEAIAQLPIRDKKILDRDYLFYYLKSFPWQTLGSTSSIATAVNSNMIKNMVIEYPSIETQRKIVSILNAIDDKIELNNKINEKLEEEMISVYSNFINNNQTKLIKVSDVVVESNTGADAIKKAPIVDFDTGVRCVRVGDMSNDRPAYEWGFAKVNDQVFKQYQLRKNDIIVTRTAALGLNAIISEDLNAVYNNGLIRLKVNKNIIAPLILYRQFRTKDYFNYIGRIVGESSTRPNMKINYLLNYSFYCLELEKQKELIGYLSPLHNTKQELIKENKRLTELRDTLLPKLMSGEIDFSKVEVD